MSAQMTDRELLELAATAISLKIGFLPLGGDRFSVMYQEPSGAMKVWNPLHDDGDALRLAVTLGLGISIPIADKRTDVISFSDCMISAIEHHGDPYAATRRAITRAAAEIGKAMMT